MAQELISPPQSQPQRPSSSSSSSSKADLISEIINNLSESEFLNLVFARLNLPFLSITEKYKDREFWTEDFLIEAIFLRLAFTKVVEHNADCGITVYKYYNQAFRLFKWIPIAKKPTPEFIVSMSDLNTRIIAELKALDNEKGYQYVLKQAVGRIFENIDAKKYHLSIAQKLKVVLK